MVRGSGLQWWDEFKCYESECDSENMLVVCIYVYKEMREKSWEKQWILLDKAMRSGGAR